MSDFVVRIQYKNKDLETVVEKEYEFIDYTEMLNLNLKRILSEIEESFYFFNDGKQKEDWTPEAKTKFDHIRHKMLDEANAIRRLPDTLFYKNVPASTMSLSEYIARKLKE